MTNAENNSATNKLEMYGLVDSDVERLVNSLGDPDLNSRRLIRGALRELGPAQATITPSSSATGTAGLLTTIKRPTANQPGGAR